MFDRFRIIYNNIIPNFIKKWRLLFVFKKKIRIVEQNHLDEVERLKSKTKISIVFLLVNLSSWKLDSLYKVFLDHSRFDILIVICPFVSKGQDFLENLLIKNINFCKQKDYKFLVAYDEVNKKAVDIKQVLNPDIVFFTNPNNLTYKELLIDNFLDRLTCYIPYSFRIDNLYKYEFDNNLVNLTWLNFFETSIHKDLAISFARNKGKNVIVTGFPYLDIYRNLKTYKIQKDNSNQRKKIIWAPHWTIKGFQKSGLDWSCFLMYYELFLNLADEFKSEIEIIMKPHPFLKTTLERKDLWGIIETEMFFNDWQSRENCKLVNGEYSNIFIESDALIHDSGSFMTEYLVLNKPVAYLLSEKNIENRFNMFGEIVLTGHSLIRSDLELRKFILSVIEGTDTNFEKRQEIIRDQELIPDQSISETILNQINEKLR